MAKFLNKKEQVYDLKLTSYGHYLMSIGKFRPAYYKFFDDNILYDARYAMYTGSNAPEKSSVDLMLYESQNQVHKRVKEETQYLESLVLFEEVENNIGKLTDDNFETDVTATMVEPRLDVFRIDQGIGDAFLDANSQDAPAWKIVALNGEISSSATSDPVNNSKIPQINVSLNYEKKLLSDIEPLIAPDSVPEMAARTPKFADNYQIELMYDDGLIYAEEINTLLLTDNFDIEVFEQQTEDAENAAAQFSFNASGPGIRDETFTINDGTTSATFTFKETAASSTQIKDGAPPSTAAVTLAERAVRVINNYVGQSTVDLKVSAASDETTGVITITNTNGTGKKTNSEGTTARITSSDEEKIVTDGGFFTGGTDVKTNLIKKYFKEEVPQVVDGFMVSSQPIETPLEQIHTGSVEYYFSIATDEEIDPKLACRAAEIFNKESYYIDLDYDCSQYTSLTEDVSPRYFDIYGPVTEPEICQET